MAWPSGTKASTTNVDAPNDLVANARADIKQNIDNVNSIIDEFNISSPSDGDLLQYSSSSGQWEQVASSSVGASIGILELTTTDYNAVTSTIHERSFDIKNSGGFITEDSASAHSFTLAAGTYYIEAAPFLVDDNEVAIRLHNNTDDTQILQGVNDEVATTNESLVKFQGVFTLAASKLVSIRQHSTDPNNRNATPFIKFFKLS